MKIRIERASEIQGKRDVLTLPMIDIMSMEDVLALLRTDMQQYPRTEGLIFSIPDPEDTEVSLHMLVYDDFIE